MPSYLTPGVYREDLLRAPAAELLTGVPAFLGLTEKIPEGGLQDFHLLSLTRWAEFEQRFGKPLPDGYLAYAIRGFFENEGGLCYVIPLTAVSQEALEQGLKTLELLDTIDLVCAPDIMLVPADAQNLQQRLLKHCDQLGDRFALLDSSPPGAPLDAVQTRLDAVQKQRQALSSPNGALYFPWVRIAEDWVPPCGHIAGVYARSDQRSGVHKAPANEVLEGVLDLEVNLSAAEQGELNPQGINCLRAFPGRGIRIWGVRTLADNEAWRYINVRRLFLTAGRWIERNLADAVFEPHDPRLWERIRRELTGYFNDLLQRGALKGGTAEEAFFIKCDAETNPPEVQEAGQVVVEIGLAPSLPNEFVVVRITYGIRGITITGPMRPL